MKIVHVIPALTKGGAERVVVDLANQAIEDGHAVTILAGCAADAELLPAPLDPRVQFRFLADEASRPRAAYGRLLPWIVGNWSWLRAQDVLHCHLTLGSVLGTLVQAVRAIRRSDRPVVVETYHAVGMAITNRHRAIHAWLLKHRDAVAFMATDPFWERYRAARPAQLLRTIPNGVSRAPPADPCACERFRRATGLPADATVVGTVGRLVWERRPDLLLRAFAHLRRQSEVPVHFLLAGEGPERARLEALAHELEVADVVHMPGLVANPVEAFGAIDLYLTVNIGAITGVAALEAALAGLPVVALQLVKSRPERDDDWIWSSSDPFEVGAHCAELIASPKKLAALGRGQRRHAEKHFQVGAMADSYYRLYSQALARRL
jgi:glycosyltransferase involved in cell wall biosynthesis